MANLQLLLGTDKKNPVFNLLIDPATPDEILVHFGFTLLEKVKRNGKAVTLKLLLGRLYNAGLKVKSLVATFGYARTTLRRWGKALHSGDLDVIQKALAGPGGNRKLTSEIERFARARFRQMVEENPRRYSRPIREEIEACFGVRISSEVLRRVFREEKRLRGILPTAGICAAGPDSPSTALVKVSSEERVFAADLERIGRYYSGVESTPAAPAEKESLDGDEKALMRLNGGFDRKGSLPFFRGLVGGITPGEGALMEVPVVHHLGLVLLRWSIDAVTAGSGRLLERVRQWLGMVLCGALNIEQSRQLDYSVLEWIIGPQVRSARHQRTELKEWATEENTLALYRRNLGWVGAAEQSVFYYDPHSIEYTGGLPLLKGWLASGHRVSKVTFQDFIQTLAGAPVFAHHDDNYDDLRVRFVAVVAVFRTLLSGDQSRLLLFILDRGIYGLETFARIRGANCRILTWEKNYRKSQWDNTAATSRLFMSKVGNDQQRPVTYEIEWQERRWPTDPTFRQFLARIHKPGQPVATEVSILSDAETEAGQDLVAWMLNRWVQENDFLYEIRCFGINYITSYDHYSYAQIATLLVDRQIANPEHAALCARRLQIRRQWGLELVRQEERGEAHRQWASTRRQELDRLEEQRQHTLDEDERRQLHSVIKKQRLQLKRRQQRRLQSEEKAHQRIQALQTQIKEVAAQLDQQPEQMGRLERLIQEGYCKLNFAPKAFMDAIKITARNLFFRLHQEFRIRYNNHRHDHVILRELTGAVGSLRETAQELAVILKPSRQYAPAEANIIATFLHDISSQINREYQLSKPIRISLSG